MVGRIQRACGEIGGEAAVVTMLLIVVRIQAEP
jgi:hypothetical protein